MNKLFLALSLLTFAYANAAVKLDVAFKNSDKEVNESRILSTDCAGFVFDTIGFNFKILEQDVDAVRIEVEISSINAQGESEVISKPVLMVTWGNVATITCDSTNEAQKGYTLTLTPSKI